MLKKNLFLLIFSCLILESKLSYAKELQTDPLETFFPVTSWKDFYKSLSSEEKKELKDLSDSFNNCFDQIGQESSLIAEPYQYLLEKYRKYKDIENCCMEICYNLADVQEAKKIFSCKPVGELTKDFCKSLSSEEEAGFQDFISKLKEFWKKSISLIQPILESKSKIKAKLEDYCKKTNQTLIITLSCDHPVVITECVRLIN